MKQSTWQKECEALFILSILTHLYDLLFLGGKNFFNPYEKQNEAVALPQQWQSKLPLTIHHQKSGVKRPSTPEEHRKNCLDCGNMKDFIFGLQREVKRLQVSLR